MVFCLYTCLFHQVYFRNFESICFSFSACGPAEATVKGLENGWMFFIVRLCAECPCLAEYSDGKYYRAKLLGFSELTPSVKLLVRHVDFGSDDIIPTHK